MKKFILLFVMAALITPATLMSQSRIMEPETLWKMGRISDVQVSPDGSRILYGVTYYDVDQNKGSRDLYVMDVEGGEATNLTNTPQSESSGTWRPDGQKIGFLRATDNGTQLWEMNPDGSNPTQVSEVAGGITGFGYSPDLQHVFFTKKVKIDATVIDRHPDLEKANAYLYDELMYRHWDTWKDGTYGHVFVAPYHPGSLGAAIDIMENEPYHAPLVPFGGTSQITWSPEGDYLIYTSKKKTGRDYALSTNTSLYRYELATGITTDLTAFNMGYDMNPSISPDGRYLAWESMEKEGFEADKSRIMIMDLQAGTHRDYSAGFDQSSSDFKWSADSRTLYFVSGIHATYQLYALDMRSGKIDQITDGTHNYGSVAPAGDYLIAQRMSMSMPTEIFRVDPQTKQQEQITFVNKPILDELKLGKVEERWVKTTDDKEMLVWVIYPPNFDPNKKYPALLYCGGGPQSAVSQFFSYRWNFQIMAANDYIVVAPNRRGLPTFGQEWNDQISEDYGGQNAQDLLAAIDHVKEEPFVDENRLGAVGASYGGFSVYWLAGNHQNRFSAFIAHSGMYNFESWYGTTEEMFFANHDIGGPFWENPRPHSYDFSPHRFVGNWDTPIMVIHGAMDFRVPLSQGMEAYNAAQLQGIPSRLLVFPDENHWVLTPQNGILWQREFFRWLDQWLKE
ncbi:MAG: S9 family peptidase [Bacteroidales bacterium]